MPMKRYAVVGGGPMGLGMIKSLKEENLTPVCYERTSHIGGLWRYHDDDVEGLASVMKTTIINSSKEIGAMSDFPPKTEAPNYMHNREVHGYLTDYAKHFDLERHIHLNMEVTKIEKAEDYDTTGRLRVAVKNIKTEEVSEDVFDGVLVCIGHHVYPNMPNFEGMETFKGQILHTHSLKRVDQFEDKNVVVVGVGNSGLDAAVEISSVAYQVYLSTRRGAWVLSRVGPWGIPVDLLLLRRCFRLLMDNLPYNMVCFMLEKIANDRFDHSAYNLKPKHRVLGQHATISDNLPIKLLSGTVKICKNIKRFVEDGVIFDEDDHVTKCDAVVFATGYKIKFPFLNDELTTVKNNEVHLYKYVFPPHLKHPTLAIMGLVQIVGGGFPLGEMQARWVSLILNNKLSLPSKQQMEEDIKDKKIQNEKRYTKSERHTIQADYIPYMDEIGAIMGVKPNLFKLLFTDPVLFWTLFTGPSLPYQYRLQGPHSWTGARQTLLDWDKRVMIPLNSNYKRRSSTISIFVALFIILLAVFWLF